MANKQQAMKAKKDARQKNKAKARVKAVNTNSILNPKRSAGGFNDKTKSVYDLLNDVRSGATKIKSKVKAGEIPEVGIDRISFLKGVNESLSQVIKVHAGIAVYTILSKEDRFAITPGNAKLIEDYERAVIRFIENIDAIVIMDQAKKLPEDYVEIVIDVTDTIRDLMVILHNPTYEMLKRKELMINRYVTEHIPTGMDVFEYMRTLHEIRAKEIAPLYHTATGISPKEIADMVLMTQSLIDSNTAQELAEADNENMQPNGNPDVEVTRVAPQDPITEERNKEAL